MTRRIRFRVLVIALGLVLFAVSAAALFMTGDFSDPSLSGLIYTIEPDVMPLAIQTVGSDWLYTGDNLGLMYRDGEYSLVGGSWISANAFSVKETVPLASGGSSAWTVADVSSALSRMQTISSYLMGSTGVIGYSLYWPSGGEISFNSQSVGDILSRFASFQTLGTSNIYSRLAGLMGTSGSISTTYQTIGTSQPVSGTSSSLGDLLSSFMSSSTRNQYILGNYLMSASGEMPVTVFSGDSGSTSYTATSLSALISYVSAYITRNQQSTYSRLSGLMGSSGSVTATGYFTAQADGTTKSYSSIGALLGDFMSYSTLNDLLFPNIDYLSPSGLTASRPTYMSTPALINNGLLGLSTILRGSSGSVISATNWSFDSDLNKSSSSVRFSNVLQALASIQSSLQQPLSQLQAVLANDDDLELRQRTQAQVEQVTSDFTGDGAAAPSLSDISDMASFSGQMSSLFSSGSSVGDFFSAAGSSDAYQFFSQAVADDLDSTSSVVALSVVDDLDPLDGFVLGDDGFYTLADTSFFDLSAFRGR